MKRLSSAVLASALLLLAQGPIEALGLALRAPAPAGAQVASTPYYPLAVGNTWHCKVGQNKYTVKVTKFETVGKAGRDGKGVLCARLEMSMNNKPISFEHLAVFNKALCRFSFGVPPKARGESEILNLAVPPIPILQVPPKAGGKAWLVESKVGKQIVKAKFTPCEKEVEVSVPAGSYKNAFSVTSEDLAINGVDLKLTYYFVENVGLVKLTIGLEKQQVVFELEKFEKAEAKKE